MNYIMNTSEVEHRTHRMVKKPLPILFVVRLSLSVRTGRAHSTVQFWTIEFRLSPENYLDAITCM